MKELPTGYRLRYSTFIPLIIILLRFLIWNTYGTTSMEISNTNHSHEMLDIFITDIWLNHPCIAVWLHQYEQQFYPMHVNALENSPRCFLQIFTIENFGCGLYYVCSAVSFWPCYWYVWHLPRECWQTWSTTVITIHRRRAYLRLAVGARLTATLQNPSLQIQNRLTALSQPGLSWSRDWPLGLTQNSSNPYPWRIINTL